MTAVFRLVLTYFAGSPLSRGMTVLGLTLLVTGIGTLLYLPPLLGSQGLPSALSLAQESLFLSMPLFALLALFLGSTLMPLMFVDVTRSRLLHVLPAARVKVLASVMITVGLLSIVAGVAVTAQYVRLPIELHRVFMRTVTVTFLTFTLILLC